VANYHPVDAGQLLFGPVTKILGQMGQERRARSEREGVRAEDLRRYEAQQALDAERRKERKLQYGAKVGFEAMRHATPESLPMWMDEMRRVGTPLADYEGTLTPTQGMVPTGQTELIPMRSDEWLPTGPAMPIALPPAIGGPEDPMGPPEFALQKERGVVFGRPAEGIPEYELGEIAPTHPLGAAVHARIGREETKRLRGLKEKASEYFGKSLSPIEQARHFGIHYLDPKTGEVADMPIAQALRHIEGMEEETAAELNAKIDLARAGRSGRRGPRPLQAPEGKLKRLISRGNFAGYRRMAKAGNILELRGASEEQIQAAWDKDRMGYESDVMDKARRHSENKRMKVMLKRVAELQQQRRVGSAKWSARKQESLKNKIGAELRGMDSLGSILDERTARGVDSPAASGDVVPPGTKTPTDAGAAKPKARQKVRPIRPKMGDKIDQETGQTLESALFTAKRQASPAATRKYLKDAFADVLRQNVQEVIVSTPSGDVNIIELLKAESLERQSLLLEMLTSTTKVDLSPGAVEAKAREEARRKRERQAQIKALGGR
jgi:hypothetical protein